MGREVRMVPKGWKHPKYRADHHERHLRGRYIPLLSGTYTSAAAEWDEGHAAWQRGEIENYAAKEGESKWKPKDGGALECVSYSDWSGDRPSPDAYMPDFPEGSATMLMMYENTSEGTPISPAFDTPEELARWLADTGASAFGGSTATYEQWLSTCERGWAISAVGTSRGLVSGVEGMA